MNGSKLVVVCVCLVLALLSMSGESLPPDCISVDEIQPGMRGYGKTVFKGDQIERFEVEILGVFYNAFAQQDMVLARLSGGPLVDIGVIAGMSGSPIYIQDRILGAVAYGWTFSKEPICGITPIENMLKVWEVLEQEENEESAEVSLVPVDYQETIRVQLNDERVRLASGLELPSSLALEPLSTPMFVSGGHPLLLERIKEHFAPYHIMPVMSGQATEEEQQRSIKIEPGSALGVQLLTGDVDVSVVGTVTYVQDNKLLGFGHPMFLNGKIEVGMNAAIIYSIMPSIARPFKLGVVANPIGTLRQDRLPAVAGVFGAVPRMVPFEVAIQLPEQNERRKFSYAAWHDKEFTPMLFDMALYESLLSAYKLFGDTAAQLKYRIVLENGSTVEKQDFISSTYALFSLSFGPYYDLSRILNNPYQRVRVQEVSAELELISKIKQLYLKSVLPEKNLYQPGEAVTLSVLTQEYLSEKMEERKFEIPLPAELKEGKYGIVVCDGNNRTEIEAERAPGRRAHTNLEQYLENIERTFPNNKIYVLLAETAPGLTVKGVELPALPPSVSSALRGATSPGLLGSSRGIILWEEAFETGSQVMGSQTVRVEVRRRKVK